MRPHIAKLDSFATRFIQSRTLVSAALAAGVTPSVIDGDTVKVAGVSIRLVDFDAPELFNPRCVGERRLAERARDALERLKGELRLELTPLRATSNYGRLCARASVAGRPLAEDMIRAGLGASYVCGSWGCPRRQSWCHQK